MGHAKDIWGHSSELGTKHYAIFAVGDDIVTQQAFMSYAKYHRIGYKPLKGSYNGHTETSFIVNADYIPKIAADGWLKGQESILALGTMDSRDRRAAKLIYLNTDGWPTEDNMRSEEDLGVFTSVSREEALGKTSWTFDPANGEYFITVDPNEVRIDAHGLQAAEAVETRYGVYGISRNVITAYLKNARS